MTSLEIQEVMIIVNQYIGVSGGYLGDFNYRTHAEFYSEYCNLDINPYQLEGTTRERFIEILKSSPPDVQARIVRGVLQRFPLNDENKPSTRTEELYNKLLDITQKLERASPITSPEPRITSRVVERAIQDVETSLKINSPVSGVDRIHTALHGYLRAVCDKENIVYRMDDTMTRLLKLIRQQHPTLINLGSQSSNIERILNSFGNVLDTLNPIRNNASVAHPNENLLDRDEAMLVINAARTILHYLDAKLN